MVSNHLEQGKAVYRLQDFRPLRRHDSPSSRSESLICLTTELKYLQDLSNDRGDAPHGEKKNDFGRRGKFIITQSGTFQL